MTKIEAYSARAERHTRARDAERRVSLSLSRWRLATVLPALAFLVVAIERGAPLFFAASAALFLIFFFLVVRHARVDERASWFEALRVVNARAVARIERKWEALPPAEPPDPVSEAHAYAVDLDVFGRASLFQWLGPAATAAGSATLSRWLLGPAQPDEIRQRQLAVEELAPRQEWREHFAAFGAVDSQATPLPVGGFLTWAESRTPLLPYFGVIQRRDVRAHRVDVDPHRAACHRRVAGAVAHPARPWADPLVRHGVRHPPRVRCRRHGTSGRCASTRRSSRTSPARGSRCSKLASLQERLGSHSEPAPAAMRRLNRILGFAELRHGSALLHFPIQAVTLWDFHVLFALERWRRSTGPHVRDWLEAAGEMDALACLSAVRDDNPSWCQPRIVEERVLRATALGHPLIPDNRRVSNDVSLGPPGSVLLITGSNMSGKSTLLRAIGLNAVLAQAGAPVCAADFQMPAADLHTSIRIHDSLELGISYFMAALARLKSVVDAGEREPGDRVMLYLLDEILQGTNSVERGMAVQAVARHLLAAPAIGAITTHDLGVAEEEPLRSSSVLVHFTETVDEAGTMSFDYTLRPGLATSRNAMRLMKLIGID